MIEMKKVTLRRLGVILCTLQTFFFVMPAQAATRNDFLFNLKDTFNSSPSSHISTTELITTMVFIVLIILFFFSFSSEQNKRRSTRKLIQYKKRMQRQASRQPGTGQQKRSWFRLATKTEFRWIPAEQASRVKTNRYKLDHLVDISGGGMCFTTKDLLQIGNHIKILLSTGQGDPLFLDGKVIRVVSGDDMYRVSVEFVGIRDGQRDRIVSWITESQRMIIHGEKPEKKRLGSDD